METIIFRTELGESSTAFAGAASVTTRKGIRKDSALSKIKKNINVRQEQEIELRKADYKLRAEVIEKYGNENIRSVFKHFECEISSSLVLN